MKNDSQVLVVGAGPVGLALAAELEIAGIPTVVVEQLAEPDTLQRPAGSGSWPLRRCGEGGWALNCRRATRADAATTAATWAVPKPISRGSTSSTPR